MRKCKLSETDKSEKYKFKKDDYCNRCIVHIWKINRKRG